MYILFLYSIQSEIILFVTNLIDMSFFIPSTNVIFGLPLPFIDPLLMLLTVPESTIGCIVVL